MGYQSSDVSFYQESFYKLVHRVNKLHGHGVRVAGTIAEILIQPLHHDPVQCIKGRWLETKNNELDYHNKIDFVESGFNWEAGFNDWTVQHREINSYNLRVKFGEITRIGEGLVDGNPYPRIFTFAKVTKGGRQIAGIVVIDAEVLYRRFLTYAHQAVIENSSELHSYIANDLEIPPGWWKRGEEIDGTPHISFKGQVLPKIFGSKSNEWFADTANFTENPRAAQQPLL